MLETKNKDLFNKVDIFEAMKSHIYEPNIRLISLSSLMFNSINHRAVSEKTVQYGICLQGIHTNDKVLGWIKFHTK